MKINEIINEAVLDPSGCGQTPYGTDIDYFGLRVQMKPSTFLELALPLGQAETNPEIEKHMQGVARDTKENIDEGIIDFISKAKDKFLRLKDALSDEWAQSKEMWRIVKKGSLANAKEINFANEQFKDILRVVGLASWYSLPIPGNTLLILATEKLLNKAGMSIIPDKIRNQVLTDIN